MLYQLHEQQRALGRPFADMAHSAAKTYGSPMSMLGQNPFTKNISAGYDLMHRLGKDYKKPEFNLNTIDIDGISVVIHEHVELDKPFCKLLNFSRFSNDVTTLKKIQDQPVVLIVAPPIRSLCNALARYGQDNAP